MTSSFFSPQDALHSGNVSQSSRFVVVKKVVVWFVSRGSLLSCKYLGPFYRHRRRRIPVRVYTVTGSLRRHNVSQPLLGSKDFVDANGSTEDQAGATFTVYFCCFRLLSLSLTASLLCFSHYSWCICKIWQEEEWNLHERLMEEETKPWDEDTFFGLQPFSMSFFRFETCIESIPTPWDQQLFMLTSCP